MSTFSRVYKPYTLGGKVGGVGVCENQHFFCTLLTFWPDYLFSWGFLALKKCWCVLFFLGGEGVSESMVCTLMKMLTFMDGSLFQPIIDYLFINISFHFLQISLLHVLVAITFTGIVSVVMILISKFLHGLSRLVASASQLRASMEIIRTQTRDQDKQILELTGTNHIFYC